MLVTDLIDEVHRKVPSAAPIGTRWKAQATLTLEHARHTVAAAVRIDHRGRRREQFWCDGVRVERQVLLRLTCPETECPHAIQVRAQWRAFHRSGASSPTLHESPRIQPLMQEIPIVHGPTSVVARPARFPCMTPCPHQAHPPLTIAKSGFDLFEQGACLGGGVSRVQGTTRPRIPTLRAAEAFVLACRLESLAALRGASDSSLAR